MPAARKRAMVLSGGGAKGVFEAGVLKACHHTGLRFDVLTGSSIGAINAVLFAEYLRRRKLDPASADRFFDLFLTIWEDLEASSLVDFDALEPLIDDLSKVEIGLDDLLHIWWGLTSESLVEKLRGSWNAILAFLEIDDILPLGLREAREMLADWQAGRTDEVKARLRVAVAHFLERHGATRGLYDGSSLRRAMIEPFDESSQPPLRPEQGLRSFREAGVDVRLTRTNIRTGQLELSVYRSFPEVMEGVTQDSSQAADLIMGDPNAISAALTSGAFPLVFEPGTLDQLYPRANPENGPLWAVLEGPDAAARFGITPQQQMLLAGAYPRPDDLYLDGGAIDNQPLSAAIGAVRDAARRARSQRAARDIYRATHDVYLVFLGPEPKISELPPGEVQRMLSYEYALRALDLQQNTKLLNDASTAERITRIMAQASGWRNSDRPKRILVDVHRIYPEEMLTTTLVFDRRMGFDRDRNRRLMSMGCYTMLDVMASQLETDALPHAVQTELRRMRQAGATAGQWTCTQVDCGLRDVCRHA